jgi:YD repeat-containing protein
MWKVMYTRETLPTGCTLGFADVLVLAALAAIYAGSTSHHVERDVIGRLRAQQGPDNTRIALDYDAHDNLTRLTPPGRSAHQLRYTGADQAERYIPPALVGVDAEVGFRYDADLAPDVANGPGDQRVTFRHDEAGRIESIALARGDYVHEYNPSAGHLAYLTSPGLHYSRDGPLLREILRSTPGAADVRVGFDYDDAFRPWKLTIQGEPPIEHGYDADDHLIQAGPLETAASTRRECEASMLFKPNAQHVPRAKVPR